MSKHVYHFRFDPEMPITDLEDILMLALVALNSLYGLTRLRLDCRLILDRKQRQLLIDGTTRAGYHLALIFTGVADYLLGNDEFRLFRIEVTQAEVTAACQPGEPS
jgi:hypothetical protein